MHTLSTQLINPQPTTRTLISTHLPTLINKNPSHPPSYPLSRHPLIHLHPPTYPRIHSSVGTIDVLVATDVAARGLDIANVDLVLQSCPPMDHDTYVHRSGRTGCLNTQTHTHIHTHTQTHSLTH